MDELSENTKQLQIESEKKVCKLVLPKFCQNFTN